MVESRSDFFEYLQRYSVYTPAVEVVFDKYYQALQEENAAINLYSRRMPPEEIWLRHFWDSVSIVQVFTGFSGKRVLDFGSGGGLPGVPLKILFPQCEMSFLDATQKKIAALQRIISHLGLQGVSYLPHRAESIAMHGYFDIIVSRGVRITPQLSGVLSKLVRKGGRLYFYKGRDYSDTGVFTQSNVYNIEPSEIGERKIVEILL